MYAGIKASHKIYAEAAKLFRDTADHRHWSATRDLAVLYLYGRRVPRDYNAAAMWLGGVATTEIVQYGPANATTGQQRLW